MNAHRWIVAVLMLGAGGPLPAQGPETPDRDRAERRPRPPVLEPRDRFPDAPPGARPERPFPPGREEGPGPSPDQVERILQELRDLDPGRAERMIRMRERDPEHFLRALREVGEHVRNLRRLREQDPAEFERVQKIQRMEGEAEQLAEEIRRAPAGEDRERMTEKLRERLGVLFDAREAGREREVAELEKRLAELRRVLQERRERKAEIVKRRVGQMLGKEEILEW